MKAGGGEVLTSEVGLLGRESGELGEGSRSRRQARGSSLSATGPACWPEPPSVFRGQTDCSRSATIFSMF